MTKNSKNASLRKAINAILARDMPGWSVAMDAVLPPNLKGESFLIKIVHVSGLVTKAVVISQGRVTGMQG